MTAVMGQNPSLSFYVGSVLSFVDNRKFRGQEDTWIRNMNLQIFQSLSPPVRKRSVRSVENQSYKTATAGRRASAQTDAAGHLTKEWNAGR